MRIFGRLMGLETEYAIRYRAGPGAERPTDHQLYSRLAVALRCRLPTAEAASGKQGLFLANGGAVWFERFHHASQTGLVEGSTPECHGPHQLLVCQRAQDRLLAETARQAAPGAAFCLLKNCRDSQGQIYGAQENYEVVLARGLRLAVWRVAWALLYPLAMAYALVVLILLVVVLLAATALNGLVAGPAYLLVCAVARPEEARRRQLWGRLFGRHWVTGNGEDMPWPDWMEELLYPCAQVAFAPLFLLLGGLVTVTDLWQTQQRLLPFLASRAVLGGSGWLDSRGCFHVTEKAETRRAVWLEILADSSRPVFNLAHFFKLMFAGGGGWRQLLAPRQRLQISLGDSNLCDEAEYLRVATTALVLDAIEAGALPAPPALHQPLRAVRQISRDPTLCAAVLLRGGTRMTALQLQHWYLDACRRFVEQTGDAPPEAHTVLRLWADVLARLATDRRSLVGRLDWVTKQFLLEEAGAGLPRAARKKIDLRYHELSPAGYHRRLEAAGQTTTLVSGQEVEQAMRMPPPSSPALARARYIREFSGGKALLKVGWRFLEIVREGGGKTTIDLQAR